MNKKKELFKKQIIDDDKGLKRIVWAAIIACPVCQEEVEVIFEERPSKLEELEASFMPCDCCLKKLEHEEFREKIFKASLRKKPRKTIKKGAKILLFQPKNLKDITDDRQ